MDIKLKNNPNLNLDRFTQLEYIESTGTQYIDTGFKPTGSTKIELEFSLYENVTDGAIFGCDAGTYNSNSFGLYSGGGTNKFGLVYGNSGVNGVVLSLNTKYTVVIEKSYQALYDSTTKTPIMQYAWSNPPASNLNLQLFALNRAGTIIGQVKCNIYYAKLYENNILVHNFIPALDSKDTPCMYDNISTTFFYNMGTGDFVAGPKVPSTGTGLPKNILLKTTTFYHKNTPNVSFIDTAFLILDYQKSHQDEVKEYYYPTTQLWQDIITEYPDILYWYNIDHKFCIYICEADDPEQCAEDFLNAISNIQQELEDYPDLIPIIAENPGVVSVIAEYPSIAPIISENPSLAPIIVDNPEVVHSLVDTGYETSIKGNGAQYLDTGLAGNSAMEIQLRLKCGTGAQDLILGNSWTGAAYIVHRNGNSIRAYWGGNADFAVSDITKFINIVYKSNYASVDNVSKEIAGNPSLTTGTLKLLGFGNNYNNQYSQLNYYKRYDDNVLIQWLVPIQNNGNPCMIDLLTGTKYLNQGTGSFTYFLEPKNV